MPKYGPVRPGRTTVTWVEPPAAARAVAREALARRKELPKSKRGGLGLREAKEAGITSGVERAKSIERGDLQPAEDLRDFFNRFSGTYEDAVGRGLAWEDSKVQQAWDLWGGQPMREVAARALVQAKPKPNPDYRSMAPTEPIDIGVWGEEVLDYTEAATQDPELRLLMGPRTLDLLRRLGEAPRRRVEWERVSREEIDPVEQPDADEGWYRDAYTGRWLLHEDELDPPFWLRQLPHPPGSFTLGEMIELEYRLWEAGEAVAQAAQGGLLTRKQRMAAIGLLDAAEDLRMRVSLNAYFHGLAAQEKEAFIEEVTAPRLQVVERKLKNRLLQ